MYFKLVQLVFSVLLVFELLIPELDEVVSGCCCLQLCGFERGSRLVNRAQQLTGFGGCECGRGCVRVDV